MRKSKLVQSLLIVLIIFLVTTPTWAALRDAYVGDVAVVAWLDDQTVKVALANDSNSRKSITIASQGWDQRWRPFFLERTVVVPARSVIVEAFALSSTWRGEALTVEATAWDRRAVVEVQTSDIFNPTAYVVRSQEDVEVRVDLSFMLDDKEPVALAVDYYYRGLANSDIGRIQVRSVDGGFKHFPSRNSVEFVRPQMLLTMRAPVSRGELTVFTFSLYKQQEGSHWNTYRDEIPGPTILVYGRGLQYWDNTHLKQPPTPSWEWNY